MSAARTLAERSKNNCNARMRPKERRRFSLERTHSTFVISIVVNVKPLSPSFYHENAEIHFHSVKPTLGRVRYGSGTAVGRLDRAKFLGKTALGTGGTG